MRPTNTQTHHRTNGMTSRPQNFPIPQGISKRRQLLQRVLHSRHHVDSVNLNDGIGRSPQSRMQRRATLRLVDHLAARHGRKKLWHPSLLGQAKQQIQSSGIYRVLSDINPQVAQRKTQRLRTLRVGHKTVNQRKVNLVGI